jgi:hypothetical protein
MLNGPVERTKLTEISRGSNQIAALFLPLESKAIMTTLPTRMSGVVTCVLTLVALTQGALVEAGELGAPDAFAWPTITRECRPWAYNWWLGSAVDGNNLACELQRYHEAGLGGIHIIPIYGAKGAEARYIQYLSPKWMEMLGVAVVEAGRRGMGVDMTTGTGWCFGGPNVPEEQGGWRLQTKVVPLARGDEFAEQFERGSGAPSGLRLPDAWSVCAHRSHWPDPPAAPSAGRDGH